MTGDYLFDPRGSDEYTRDEDHLAHIIELLGNISTSTIFRGKYGLKYFTSYGEFAFRSLPLQRSDGAFLSPLSGGQETCGT